jgi:hypothetical protein
MRIIKSRGLLLALLLLCFCGATRAQTTVVSATLADPNGLPYSFATVSIQLLQGATGPGTCSQPPANTKADINGSFSLTLQDNSICTPPGSQWVFTVCPQPGTFSASLATPCTAPTAITISGASQNVSTTLNAALAALAITVSGPLTNQVMTGLASAPPNPLAGKYKFYFNTGTGFLTCLNSAGGNACPGAGAATSPGGANTNLQYNNGGVFGGVDISNYTPHVLALTCSADNITCFQVIGHSATQSVGTAFVRGGANADTCQGIFCVLGNAGPVTLDGTHPVELFTSSVGVSNAYAPLGGAGTGEASGNYFEMLYNKSTQNLVTQTVSTGNDATITNTVNDPDGVESVVLAVNSFHPVGSLALGLPGAGNTWTDLFFNPGLSLNSFYINFGGSTALTANRHIQTENANMQMITAATTPITLSSPGGVIACATCATTTTTIALQSCGTTSSCSATPITSSPKMVFGSVALVSGTPSTATITGISPAFTSSTTYVCTATEVTNALNNLLSVANVSGSSFTITGPATVSDTVNYTCVGN